MINQLRAMLSRQVTQTDTVAPTEVKKKPAEARLTEHAQSMPMKRRDARAALEFNAKLPARTWQDGVKPIKQRSSALPMTVRTSMAKAPASTATASGTSSTSSIRAEQPAARQPLRGQRMFGFGTGGVAQPSAKPLLTAEQELRQLVGDSDDAGDLSGVESLLQALEKQGEVPKPTGSQTAEVRLGPAEFGSARMRVQRTGIDDKDT